VHDTYVTRGEDEAFLEKIINSTLKSNETLGILLHGSFATHSQAQGSDIDLICVTTTGPFARFLQSIEGSDLDVISASRTNIESRIRCQTPTNNNSILYAFVRGRSLLDRDGTIAALIYEATQIWGRGPTTPSQEEAQGIVASAQSSLQVADRLRIRAARSAEWLEIAHLRSSVLFIDCVHNFCRSQCLWSSAIWEILKWTDPRYEYLQAIMRGYLRAPSLENRLRAIRDIAKRIIANDQHGRLG
jgi:hypothetical protein